MLLTYLGKSIFSSMRNLFAGDICQGPLAVWIISHSTVSGNRLGLKRLGTFAVLSKDGLTKDAFQHINKVVRKKTILLRAVNNHVISIVFYGGECGKIFSQMRRKLEKGIRHSKGQWRQGKAASHTYMKRWYE